MGLSRLENFLKSVKGATIHVNSDSLDSTDSIDNDGSSIIRPFKNIQRAIVEAVKFSYRSGLNNDSFARTTIIIHPSTYDIDNRPGIVVKNDGSLVYRSGQSATIREWDLTSNFNIYDSNNDLYKLNSVHGGVIIPRGITLWAYDERKTIIRPLYVPNPSNTNIGRSAIFRLTAATLPESFTWMDSDPNGKCFKDYTTNQFTPNFSHHKLDCYQFVDGVNNVNISDTFLTVNTSKTDLEMYYEKIAKSYNTVPDALYSPSYYIDLEPVIDEYRIVGSRGKEIGITSIAAGDGVNATTTITVNLNEDTEELAIDTPIQISGVGQAGYDGKFVVYNVIDKNTFQYKSTIVPTVAYPSTVGSTMNLTVDTVTSSSPYIKNNTIKSVYGLCGLFGDGSVVDGFKSVLGAQFTGISLQKDDNAFVKYDPTSGTYVDSSTISNLHKDPNARYKPEYEHYHIKLTNDAFAEVSASFAIGYAKQFEVQSGGDLKLNASKSNFGSKSFVADGFKKEAYEKDDLGYIVGVTPPRIIHPLGITSYSTFTVKNTPSLNVDFLPIDVTLTSIVANNGRLYLYNQKNQSSPPDHIIDGYRIGAKRNELIGVEDPTLTTNNIYTSRIVIPQASNSYENAYSVQRINGNTENAISNNILSFTTNHTLTTGEKVRVISSNGQLPSGLNVNTVYYVITQNLNPNQIKLANTYSNALSNVPISINRKGGILTVTSRVSDKKSGEIGHPIQWDSTNKNWYISILTPPPPLVGPPVTTVYSYVTSIYSSYLASLVGPPSPFGPPSPILTIKSFITRTYDSRVGEEKVYKLRYVIPNNTLISSRPPIEGYVLQESNSTKLNPTELTKYFSTAVSTFSNINEIKNPHYISDVKWSGGIATIYSETPHNLTVGSKIETFNVIVGTYTVTEVVNNKQFKVALPTNPGVFNKNTTVRDSSLPYFKRLETKINYQLYKVHELQEYIYNKQDGVYDLIILNNSVSPTVAPFTNYKFSQPIENLFPQFDRDNPNADPDSTVCHALPDRIGEVVVNNEENSITRETYDKFLNDFNISLPVTSVISTPTGLAHTITVTPHHNFNSVTNVNIDSAGSSYLPGTYYAAELISGIGSGRYATARISVNGSGNLSAIKIMDGGCAYGIGETATVVPAAGFGTTTGFIPAVVSVANIVNNINDTIYFSNSPIPARVTGINSHNKIEVTSSSNITNASSAEFIIPTAKAIAVNTLQYNPATGIGTIIFDTSHYFSSNYKVAIDGFDSAFLNQNCLVQDVLGITSIVVNLGSIDDVVGLTGSAYVYPTVTSNNNKVVYHYAGISTVLNAVLTRDSLTDTIVLNNATLLGLNIGDYLKVDDEILRIKSDITTNFVSVFRSQLGTVRDNHASNSVVQKIKIIPIEFRRSSLINASSHTFEYVGYGPGNYSTSLPEKQGRVLSEKERTNAYSFKTNGGSVYYNAIDENGFNYRTNRRINPLTGVEEHYNSPLFKNVGDETNCDMLDTCDVHIEKSLKVSGGHNSDIPSEFNGPIIFNNKITSYSDKGIEALQFFIQGDEKVSRRIGIGATFSPVPGGYGDIIFNSRPEIGSPIGWTYTKSQGWRGFGTVF